MAAKSKSKNKAAKKSAKKKTNNKAAAKRPSRKQNKANARGRGKGEGAEMLAGTQQLPFEGNATQVDMLYPAGTIAEVLMITPRRLRQLAADGLIPKATRGRYPMKGCVQAYIRYLQTIRISSAEHSGEKTRLTKARAETYEIELAEKRGELYRRDVVDQALFEACTNLTAMLDGSASRIASQLGGGAALRKRLLDAFREIRTQYAAGLREFSERLRQDGWDRRPATRRPARKVGKRKSRAAKRKRRARSI